LSSPFPSQHDQVFSRVLTVVENFQFLTNLTPDALGLEAAAQHHERTEVAGDEIDCVTASLKWLSLNRRVALELELHSASREQLADVVFSAPQQWRLGKVGWRRQVGTQRPEEVTLAPLWRPVAQSESAARAKNPRQLRRRDPVAANMQPNVESTTSKLLSG